MRADRSASGTCGKTNTTADSMDRGGPLSSRRKKRNGLSHTTSMCGLLKPGARRPGRRAEMRPHKALVRLLGPHRSKDDGLRFQSASDWSCGRLETLGNMSEMWSDNNGHPEQRHFVAPRVRLPPRPMPPHRGLQDGAARWTGWQELQLLRWQVDYMAQHGMRLLRSAPCVPHRNRLS